MTPIQMRAGIVARLSAAIDNAGGCQPVAEVMLTTYQAVHNWQTGKYIPGGLSLAQLCRALKVSADWILLGEKQ